MAASNDMKVYIPHGVGLVTAISTIIAAAAPAFTTKVSASAGGVSASASAEVSIFDTSLYAAQAFLILALLSSFVALAACVMALPGKVKQGALIAKVSFALTALFSTLGWILTVAGTGDQTESAGDAQVEAEVESYGAGFAFAIIAMLLGFGGAFVSHKFLPVEPQENQIASKV